MELLLSGDTFPKGVTPLPLIKCHRLPWKFINDRKPIFEKEFIHKAGLSVRIKGLVSVDKTFHISKNVEHPECIDKRKHLTIIDVRCLRR